MINGSFCRLFYREFDRDLERELDRVVFSFVFSTLADRDRERERSRLLEGERERERDRLVSSLAGDFDRKRDFDRVWERDFGGDDFLSDRRSRDLDRVCLFSLLFSRLREFERERLRVSLRDFERERDRLLCRRLSRESDLLRRRRRRSRLLDLLRRLSRLDPRRGSLLLMDPGDFLSPFANCTSINLPQTFRPSIPS